mgnify:CR=1 FL=1
MPRQIPENGRLTRSLVGDPLPATPFQLHAPYEPQGDQPAAIAEMDRSHVQIYLVELPAKQIAEWGRILPDPDEEAEWIASIPAHVKKRMDDLMS